MRRYVWLAGLLLWAPAPERSKLVPAPSEIKLQPGCTVTRDFTAERQLSEIIDDEDQALFDEVLMLDELLNLDDEKVNKIIGPHLDRQEELAKEILRKKRQYVQGSE